MLQHTFSHLQGIGPATEVKIWSKGIHSWDDLLASTSPPLSAGKMELIRPELERATEHREAGDAEFFGERLKAPETWRLFPDFKHELAFVDIETDGSTENNITTIAYYDGEHVRTYVQGENIEQFAEDIQSSKVLVTYNGRCFDVPVLKRSFDIRLPKAHIDLRNILCALGIKGGLKKCEKHFGLDRKELDGVDGFFAVVLWNEYERTCRSEVLDTLLSYNVADVLGLEILLFHAINARLLDTPFAHLYTEAIPSLAKNPFTPDVETIERLRVW
ncbi:ribonuclease H-like domain-containing protein [Desulfovibrio inopinatus]|uniref:ribonuclease H-like domain-containing protein n=1 Tax=Desulfovibrio inopinatus TaxID=102109 RepID=UPI000406A590|nr:ribonuclease H-like domain-containing protein [Desulfovibrio inopinatus]